MAVVFDVLEGLLIGIVGGLVVLYGLQPKEAYPKWMLVPYDHPWMFLVMFVVIIYVGMYNRLLGALLFLLAFSLYIDLIIFGRPTIFKTDSMPQSAQEANNSQDVIGSEAYGDWSAEGIPLSAVHIQEPNYPMFFGVHEPQPGDPAPF